METSLFTWNTLATLSGCTAATLLIVQFLKVPLDKVWKIPTRFLAWVIAFVLLLLAHLIAGDLTWACVPLVLLNSLLVALATMGAYETTFSQSDAKKAQAVIDIKEKAGG